MTHGQDSTLRKTGNNLRISNTNLVKTFSVSWKSVLTSFTAPAFSEACRTDLGLYFAAAGPFPAQTMNGGSGCVPFAALGNKVLTHGGNDATAWLPAESGRMAAGDSRPMRVRRGCARRTAEVRIRAPEGGPGWPRTPSGAWFAGQFCGAGSIGKASRSARSARIARIFASSRLAGLKVCGKDRGGNSSKVAMNWKTSSIAP